MTAAGDLIDAVLEGEWPRWEVLIVGRVQDGPVWYARRRDDHRTVINASDPGTLSEYQEDVTVP